MSVEVSMHSLIQALDDRARSSQRVQFWLRDDDAVVPSEQLERLLVLCQRHSIPLTLAVIPDKTGQELVDRIQESTLTEIAVHGWSHRNHAPDGEKKQELGEHRQPARILDELSDGYSKLANLHGSRFVPLLVPPWNRIAATVVDGLCDIGFRGLSTFGAELPAPIKMVNTHVDLIDWKQSRGGRPTDELEADIITQMCKGISPIGILTHHLVHDDNAWSFLDQLFAATASHAGAQWISISDMLALELPDPGLPGQ